MTLQLLADRKVELGLVASLHSTYETVRSCPSPAQAAVVHPQGMGGEFVAAMEDVLDLYAEPYDPQRPVVCFDETATQLLAEVREPLPVQPGRPRREDYEYRRAGSATAS